MGAGRILVVDDEKTVRTFTKLLLEQLGFEAVEAEDGLAAIEILRAQSARIAAVLLDLTMPRMDGLETLSAIRRVAPGVPVILTSGFGTSRPEDVAGGLAPEAVLRKPYKPEQLLATLQGVLKPSVSAQRP
jgi:two-component system cell cycle sensor histidine kinase/response regulator CckA